MLPAILTGFVLLTHPAEEWRGRLRVIASRTWPLWLALGGYAILRLQSGAFGPADAPSFYRFSLAPSLIFRNIVEYADRAGTVALLAVLVLAAALGRRPPSLLAHERAALQLAGLWIVGMCALTMFLPVRSSLYAVLPSFGSAIAAGACASLVLRTEPHRFAVAATILMIVVVALIPAYRFRNARWVELADTSTRVLQTLQFAAAGQQTGGRIVLIDDSRERFNLDATFGELFPDAAALFLEKGWTGEIRDANDSLATSSLVLKYEDGTVVPYMGR